MQGFKPIQEKIKETVLAVLLLVWFCTVIQIFDMQLLLIAIIIPIFYIILFEKLKHF